MRGVGDRERAGNVPRISKSALSGLKRREKKKHGCTREK